MRGMSNQSLSKTEMKNRVESLKWQMSHVAVTLSQAGNMGDLKRRSLPAVTTSWWWVGFLLVVTSTWTTSHSKPLEPLAGTTGTVLEVGKLEVVEEIPEFWRYLVFLLKRMLCLACRSAFWSILDTVSFLWPCRPGFFLTPLGRVGEDKSSRMLSFFLDFWVFSLSFEFFLWVLFLSFWVNLPFFMTKSKNYENIIANF